MEDMSGIKKLGVMLDCSRDAVYTVGTLKNYFSFSSGFGCLS